MNGKPEDFREESFWKKLARTAKKAGRKTVETALTLYYCMADPETPMWAKGVIAGALAYFILPADVIPDLLPGIGFTDDLAVLVGAWQTAAACLTAGHREKARRKCETWFGPDPEPGPEPKRLPPPA
ncbi:MAG: YkvA family protein [Planctomycetes bacterium]|nr:YkvA family protein [Planctomycetota bacterium]